MVYFVSEGARGTFFCVQVVQNARQLSLSPVGTTGGTARPGLAAFRVQATARIIATPPDLSQGLMMTDTVTQPETTAEVPVPTTEGEPAQTAVAEEPSRPEPAMPTPYAVIETGGKQYRVKVGDRLAVEHLHADPGSDLTIERVLLIGGDGSTQVGTPVVDGATVTARVDDHFRGEKIIVFKFKAKKRYRRRTGHRQNLTHLTITGINS